MTKLPANFLHGYTQTKGTSPLVSSVQSMLDDLGPILSWNNGTLRQAPFPLETVGLLTLMQWFDFDPNARLSYTAWVNRKEKQFNVSLLEAILLLGTHARPVCTDRTWPLTLEGLATLESTSNVLSQKDGLSVEFLAATLIALGADPWAEVSSEDPLGRVLPLALMNHMGGLAERIWQCEKGRPPVEALSTATPWGENKKSIVGWLEWVTAETHGSSTAAWLLGKGVVPNPKAHPLTLAQTGDMVATYTKNGIALDEKLQNKLIVAWQGHVNRQTLSESGFVSLKQALNNLSDTPSSSSLTAEEEHAIAAITKEYGEVAWNKSDSPQWGSWLRGEEHKRADADGLDKRIVISLGVLKGQWNPFVSWLFRHLRSSKDSQWTLEWLFQKPVSPRPKGWLANTIGFDWRPGISINGMMAFSLAQAQPRNAKDHHTKNFEDILHALAIDDFKSWLEEQHDAMVAFSQAFSRGDNAKEKWCENWQTVFDCNLHLRQTWSDFFLSLPRLAPIHDLESGYKQPKNFKIGTHHLSFRGGDFLRWWVFYDHREGDVYHVPDPSRLALTCEGTSELIETVLVLGTDQPQWWEALETRASQGTLNTAHQARVQVLIDNLSQPTQKGKQAKPQPVTQQARERLKGILLAASLPQASSEAKRARF